MYQPLSGSEQQKSEQAMYFIRRLEEAETSLQAETDDNDKLDENRKALMHRLIKSIKALHHSVDMST